jgi:hypothetical protein
MNNSQEDLENSQGKTKSLRLAFPIEQSEDLGCQNNKGYSTTSRRESEVYFSQKNMDLD